MQQQDNRDWKSIFLCFTSIVTSGMLVHAKENECLVFVWACKRSSDFMWGKSISGETDHKPSVPMLTTLSLDQLPPRIQRLRMRLMKFNIKRMVHVPGKQMYTSDTLSRLQCKQPNSKPEESLIPDQEMSADRETKVNADASSYRIGGVVMQQQDNRDWKSIFLCFTSIVTSGMPVHAKENECLVFVWACKGSSDFLWGKSITGETDHKPSVPMLTTLSLDQLPPRIQRLRMRLMRFNIKRMVHVPGKQMYTSDTLSRLQRKQSNSKPEESLIPDEEMSAFVCSIVDTLPVSDIKLKQIIEVQ